MTAKRAIPGAKPTATSTGKRLSLRKKTLKDMTPSGTGPLGGAVKTEQGSLQASCRFC